MDLEARNLRQIERLNQRGGRTLSIVDLIGAGTISIKMAAYAMRAMANGASLLTGARPGGAGKSTLLGALLGLLLPDVRMVTVDRSQVIREGLNVPPDEPVCYLAHEIGAGHWYGYLWGPDVADFFSLVDGRRRIASCLHADTLEELTGILQGPPLRVGRKALGQVGLILFIHVVAGGRRRVVGFWEADGVGGHRQVFGWNPDFDKFDLAGRLRDPAGLERYECLIRGLADGDAEFAGVRRKVVEFFKTGA